MRWWALALLASGVVALTVSTAVHWAKARHAPRTAASHYLMLTAVWTIVTLGLFVSTLLWAWPSWTVGAASFGALTTAAGVSRVWLTLRPTSGPGLARHARGETAATGSHPPGSG